MALTDVLSQVVLVVSTMVVIGAVTIVGPTRLRETAGNVRLRVRAVAGPAIVLALTLASNGLLRNVGADLSWLVGVNVTALIYGIEGNLVAVIQQFASPPLTAYFSFVYVFGYVFLLVFPVIAYLALADPRPLRTLLVAYVVNYSLGLVVYILVIAYGPRNLLPELVDSLLYSTYPQFQFLTAEVNVNTNVFPSLHASLSVTVALLAARTRSIYPSWFWIAVVGAASVCLSTMYLGIHWGLDVIGGVVLAVFAVRIAAMERWHREPTAVDRLVSRLEQRIQ